MKKTKNKKKEAIHVYGVEKGLIIGYIFSVVSMVNLKERGGYFLKTRTLSQTSAKGVASMLEKMLRVEANTTSCVYIYQPETPKDLQRYRRKAK